VKTYVPQSKAFGAFEEDVFGDVPLEPNLRAEGRIPRVGERTLQLQAAYHEAAEGDVRDEELAEDEVNKARYFDTTTGTYFTKPNDTLTEKAEHTRASCKLELLHGPKPDRMLHMDNPGLSQPGHTHYSNLEILTYQRSALADPRSASTVKSTFVTGANMFGKNSEFTKPMHKFTMGLHKDEELEKMYASQKEVDSFRTHGSAAPRGVPFQGIPSLPAVKQVIHKKIAEVWGAPGYVMLRQLLFNESDEEGFVDKSVVVGILRQGLGLNTDEVADKILDAYLSLQIKIKKTELHVGQFIASVRPAMSSTVRKSVIQAFERMQPVNGSIKLGAWLQNVSDVSLKEVLVTAFGGQDVDSELLAETPVTETVFLDLLADLAPLADLDALLLSN
jgi:hypothetical protein